MRIAEGNVPIQVAADILGISQTSVRGGLQAKALPIGASWHNEGSDEKTMYHISPAKLAEYMGYTKEDILEYMAERRASAGKEIKK